MGKLEDLNIYKKALDLVVKIYKLIRENSSLQKDFSLSNQLQRAAVSVAANIAEGYYRTKKQSQNYLHISSGSSNELVTLLRVVDLVHKIETLRLQEEYQYLAKQINSFSTSF